MVDTTNPISPKTPSEQDLQINLTEVTEQSEVVPQGGNAPKIETPELDLDLDLNLPDAPKDDNRLKTEDKKNQEIIKQNKKIPEKAITMPIIEPAQAEIKTKETIELTTEDKIEEIPVIDIETSSETSSENTTKKSPKSPTEETIKPSKIIEIEVSPTVAASELKNDIEMIKEIEWHESAGGLSPDVITAKKPIPVETTKTFDLDAILGNSTTPPTPSKVEIVSEDPNTIAKNETNPKQDTIVNENGLIIEPIQEVPPQATIDIPQPIPTTTIPMSSPEFTIPTTTVQTPIAQVQWQTTSHTNIFQGKNINVKIFLFIILFVGLGFTTFFILKTMYPIEFSNIFSGDTTQIETGEELLWMENTWTEMTGTEITGTEITEAEITGTQLSWIDMSSTDSETEIHGSASTGDVFGELNDLMTSPTDQTEQNDIGRLTDYVTQGNDFVTQGKTLGNTTMIKYGLYISKKASAFLDKIATGEQINNLSGYFAQFDQYLVELKKITGQNTNTPEGLSPPPLANDDLWMTPDTETPQNTWTFSE